MTLAGGDHWAPPRRLPQRKAESPAFFCMSGDAMCAEIAQVNLVLRISELPAMNETEPESDQQTKQNKNHTQHANQNPTKEKASFLAVSNSCKSCESETRKEE